MSSNNTARLAMIRARLTEALAPSELEVLDESHLHVGHAGAQTGRGHFAVRVVSSQFTARDLLSRHRMVYDALGGAMQTDIHALRIKALTPDEASH